MPDFHDIDAFWSDYCEQNGVTGPAPASTCFGDDAEMQTGLCNLVLRGVKRATASLARNYGPDGDKLPKSGDLAIVVDGRGSPRAVIEITAVERVVFNTVDARFAAEEGEGDGSLAYWIAEHRAFFTRELAADKLPFSETDEIILEHFRLIWPTPILEPR